MFMNTDNDTDTDVASSGGSEEGEGEEAAANTAATTIKKTYLLDINPYHAALTKGNGANVIDARWIDTSNGMFIDITGLRERDVEHSPGVWSCKNNHRYRTTELWPLRRTEFEDVEAWIPYAFDKVLTDEYGPKSLVTEEWAGSVPFFLTLLLV
ncbi:LicD family-domain-containing protein [Xylaria arbuscula]|nr:LicD family-domain-containing protein [Xylaria arbuscula]